MRARVEKRSVLGWNKSLSSSGDLSSESVTPKVIPNTRNNPPNLVLYVPAEPDSEPSFSYSSLSESSDSSEDEYYKR